MRIFVLILIWAGTQVQANAQEEQGFVLQTDEDGVFVWVRPESNDDLTVRVAITARASVSEVRKVIDHASAYPRWVHRCEEAYVLPGGTPKAYSYYSRVNLPFPFSDREVVGAITQSVDVNTGVFTRIIKSTPTALPMNKGIQRVETYDSTWKVEPLSDNKVAITCTVRTAAGSGLPNWLRHEIMTGGPVKTMKGLVEELEKD
ncbi:SRPBCC family protein [Neolewinella persica]|uniref:hypothetical protein n=1 Tax=Neolewinella persica TaxID=70998 RepID=UPI0003A96E10|nr:hypothetical protein [Neolewinella persica]